MALFRIQVFYQRGTGEKWSNVYHVDSADLFVAAGAASSILAPGLAPLLDTSAAIVKVLTSNPALSGSFIEAALDIIGTSTGSGDLLPLFNSARVLFPILSGGRPDYKFMKGFITESLQTNGIITPGALGVLASTFSSLITEMSVAGSILVSDTLEGWSVVTPQAAVQMRQMHRRRRRTP